MGEPVVAVVARDARAGARRGRPRRDRVRAARRRRRDDRGARPRSPLVHEEPQTNLTYKGKWAWGDCDAAFAEADAVVKIDRMHFHRFTSTPLECAGALVDYDPGTELFTLECNHQMPGVGMRLDGAGAARAVQQAARHHRRHRRRLRQQDHATTRTSSPSACWRASSSGRSTGPRRAPSSTWPAATATSAPTPTSRSRCATTARSSPCAASTPTTAAPTRATSRSAASSGRRSCRATTASRTSTSTSRRSSRTSRPAGPTAATRACSSCGSWSASSTSSPRGSSSTRSSVRKLNYVRAEEMPYTTPNGCVYDSGDYARCLDIALDLIGYEAWRERQAAQAGSLEGARDRHRLDARLRHEQLRPVAARQPGAAVLGQQRVRDGAHGAVRRHRRDARHGAAGPGPRDDDLPGRGRHPRRHARRRQRAPRLRHVVQQHGRLLGDVRQPVRRHRPRRRQGRGRCAGPPGQARRRRVHGRRARGHGAARAAWSA